MAAPDLDAWLAEPALRTVNRREAAASVGDLWEAAGTVRVGETRMLGRLVRWRIPGVPGHITFRELFAEDPFIVLEEGRTYSVSGLVGRIWTLRRDYPHLDAPEAFRGWHDRGTARVVFAHWAEAAGRGRAALTSEARVAVPDRQARLGLRVVRPLISAFEPLIGSEALALAVRRAEA